MIRSVFKPWSTDMQNCSCLIINHDRLTSAGIYVPGSCITGINVIWCRVHLSISDSVLDLLRGLSRVVRSAIAIFGQTWVIRSSDRQALPRCPPCVWRGRRRRFCRRTRGKDCSAREQISVARSPAALRAIGRKAERVSQVETLAVRDV